MRIKDWGRNDILMLTIYCFELKKIPELKIAKNCSRSRDHELHVHATLINRTLLIVCNNMKISNNMNTE